MTLPRLLARLADLIAAPGTQSARLGYLVAPGDWPGGQPSLSAEEAEKVLDGLDRLDDRVRHPGAMSEQTEQHIADDDLDEITAIRARVWEALARTGVADTDLAALIGVAPAKIAASFAGRRRFSTYELAAIAEHGGTTVEWLCGDSDNYDYSAAVTAPLTDEQAAALRQDLADGAVPRRKATVLDGADAGPIRSTRWFWWNASSLTHRWRPLYWGSEENCNRTIGLRVPGGVLFLCLTVPLRQTECEECQALAR
jgi:hypothetical protein